MEVERNPIPPQLNAKAKKLITELCFRKDDSLKEVDGIFVFSSAIEIKKLSKLIEKILEKNISKKIFITGGLTSAELARDLKIKTALTEADLLLESLNTKKFKDVRFYVEKKSTNTLANVTETLKNPEFKKCKSLLFIFKSHAAGRGYLTLRKFFQSADILQQTFDTKYERSNKKITRENWHTFAFARNRVWGEYLRIREYGSRGDIEYKSVEELMDKIEKEI